MVVGSTCSLVWERRTTCWVTMRVPDPNIPIVRRPLPVREGRDLDHHVTACSEGAGVRGHAGGGGGCAGPAFGPISVGGGGGSKRPAPLFPGPQGGPAHGLHPRFVVAEIWADKVVAGAGGGGWVRVAGGTGSPAGRVGGGGGGRGAAAACLAASGGAGVVVAGAGWPVGGGGGGHGAAVALVVVPGGVGATGAGSLGVVVVPGGAGAARVGG